MFAKLVQATWGDETGEGPRVDDADEDQVASASKDSSGKQGQSNKTANTVPSFWGVAASLADTVKKNTAEITAGLKETNWRAELEAFGKGVREEEQVLRQETAKRVEVAKEHFPKDATAQLDQKRKELSLHLQKMGVGIGSLGKRVVTGTTDLFDQVKDSLLEELSANDKAKAGAKRQPSSLPKSSSKYSRLEADISSMQRDSATYCNEPADSTDYQAWRANFDLTSYRPAVEALTQENAFMAELQARIVPIIVEYDAFWTRYYYQLHLLEARHAQRMELAQWASKPQEEEVAWDDADDQPQPSSPPQHSAATAEPQSRPEQTEQQKDKQQTVKTAADTTDTHQAAGSETAEDEKQASDTAAIEDDVPDAVTSSDSGSATEHWTVVTSPSKQANAEVAPFGHDKESAQPATAEAEEATAEAEEQSDKQKGSLMSAATTKPAAAAAPLADDDNDIDELDDVANDDSPGSEGDEDWGSWE